MSQSNIRLLRRERRLAASPIAMAEASRERILSQASRVIVNTVKFILLPEADRCFRAMLRVADREDAKAVLPPVLWYRLVQRTLPQLFWM